MEDFPGLRKDWHKLALSILKNGIKEKRSDFVGYGPWGLSVHDDHVWMVHHFTRVKVIWYRHTQFGGALYQALTGSIE